MDESGASRWYLFPMIGRIGVLRGLALPARSPDEAAIAALLLTEADVSLSSTGRWARFLAGAGLVLADLMLAHRFLTSQPHLIAPPSSGLWRFSRGLAA